MKLVVKRILAFFVDYFVIAFYAALLFLLTNTFVTTTEINNILINNLFKGQIVGFFSLTLPIFYTPLFQKVVNGELQ